MKILDISLVARLDRYDAIQIHTFSIARHLNGLVNNLMLIIGGDKNKSLNINGHELLISRFKTFSGKENILTIIYYFIYNNFSLFNKIISQKGFDIIYERHSPGLYAGLLMSKLRKIPLVYEVNGIVDEELFIDFNVQNRFLKKIISKILEFQLKSASVVIVQTEELKKIIGKRFGIKEVFVVENGSEIRKEYIKKKNDKINMVYVGVLDKNHNLEDVFEVVSSMKGDFIFKIIGDGDMRKVYEKCYNDDNRILFMGGLNHTDALEIVRDADICIASYGMRYPMFRKYGFYFCPLKILEYISFRKPTLLFGQSNSFIKEIEDVNGISVVQSKEDFIKNLKRLINDDNYRKKMGDSAREVSLRYTWNSAALKTERILKNVI